MVKNSPYNEVFTTPLEPFYGTFRSTLCIQNPYYRRIFFSRKIRPLSEITDSTIDCLTQNTHFPVRVSKLYADRKVRYIKDTCSHQQERRSILSKVFAPVRQNDITLFYNQTVFQAKRTTGVWFLVVLAPCIAGILEYFYYAMLGCRCSFWI